MKAYIITISWSMVVCFVLIVGTIAIGSDGYATAANKLADHICKPLGYAAAEHGYRATYCVTFNTDGTYAQKDSVWDVLEEKYPVER